MQILRMKKIMLIQCLVMPRSKEIKVHLLGQLRNRLLLPSPLVRLSTTQALIVDVKFFGSANSFMKLGSKNQHQLLSKLTVLLPSVLLKLQIKSVITPSISTSHTTGFMKQ